MQTASPGKLVLMLFDGCLRFTTAAKRAFEEEEFTKRNEDVNNNLIRAQNIVTELQSSLDMSVPGELPGTLYRLYDYVMHQLQQANLKKEPDTIDEAEKVISELRDAWSEMLAQNPENEISSDQQPGSISSKLKFLSHHTLSIEPKDFEFFLVALETHENLLHAETQAIAAKHLDTIESILEKKRRKSKVVVRGKRFTW